jgi:hypothetical protein
MPAYRFESTRRAWYGFLIVVLGVAIVIQLNAIKHNQGVSHQNGYKNRAVQCRLIHALGLPLDASCLNPDITQYYNPMSDEHTQSVTQTHKVIEILCRHFPEDEACHENSP